MIGIDTNVIIRFLVQDDPIQSKKASQLIEKAVEKNEVFWICLLTLCEIAWVLERCYELQKDELVFVLQKILQTKQIKVEGEDIAWKAIGNFQNAGTIGFSDCLIGAINSYHDCEYTYTFDKKVAKHLSQSFKLLQN